MKRVRECIGVSCIKREAEHMAPNDLEHKIIYFMIIELFCVHLEPIIMTLIGILKFKKPMN